MIKTIDKTILHFWGKDKMKDEELYQTPEFKVFYDKHHPKLLGFLVEAMKVFAKRELS